MFELLAIVFTIIFIYLFLTMKITPLRVGIFASFAGLYYYAQSVGV